MNFKNWGRLLNCFFITVLLNAFSAQASSLGLSSSIFNSADETIVSEENYQNYTLRRYSNGFSMLFDNNNNNWIVFKTQYEVNSFTGEISDNPIKVETYIKNRLKNLDVIAANVHDKGYKYDIDLRNDTVTIFTPNGISISTCIIPNTPINSFYDKKQSKAIFKSLTSMGAIVTTGTDISISMPKTNLYKTRWIIENSSSSSLTKQASNHTSQRVIVRDGSEDREIHLYENRMNEINRMLPRLFLHPDLLVPGLVEFEEQYSIPATISLLSEYSKIFGNAMTLRSLDGNELVSMEGVPLKLLNGSVHQGGLYDEKTNRMYNLSKDNYILQACSITTGNANITSLTDDNVFWIKCLPSDTIETIKLNDKVGELYFSNGDYLKFSRIKGGLVYDCYLTRPTGLCMIKLDTDKPVSLFKCTQGRYKNTTYELKNRLYDDLLTDPLLLNPDNNPYLEIAHSDAEWEEIDKKFQSEQIVTFETLSGDSIEAAMEAQKQKEIDNLIAKYGKKYVDALLKQGKIIIGTPEGLVRDHTNSELLAETLYIRLYKITGVLGNWAATVKVDKETKKVVAIIY